MQSAQHKKLYENVLSSGQSTQSLEKALSYILRLAISDHSHFNFLLHNINWFDEPFLNHIHVLEKALRVYRGRGKQSERVVYNILTDGMWSSAASIKCCQCLINIIKPGFDSKLLKQSLKENYPYKVAQLQLQINYLTGLLYLYQNFEPFRYDILEILTLQLASFDTELCTGDSFSSQIFPLDFRIKEERAKLVQDEDHIKFDTLIVLILEELSKNTNDQKLFKELLMIFKNDILLIQKTKYVQLIIYYFAEQNKKEAKNFLTFLFGQLLQKIQIKANRKQIIHLSNYLASYVSRSVKLSSSIVLKTIKNLISVIDDSLDKKNQNKSSQIKDKKQISQIILSQIYQDNFDILLLLQTVLRIYVSKPECREVVTNQIIKICQRCRQQIYFDYFICHQLLDEVKVISTNCNNTHKTLQIYHTFNPPLLKRLSVYLDPLIRTFQAPQLKLQVVKSQVKYQTTYEGLPTKRVKSEKRSSEQTCFSVSRD